MSEKKTISANSLRRMLRNHRTWDKAEPSINQALDGLNSLDFLRRDAALSHFIGGCRSVLQHGGAITRKDFVQLINTATDFGRRTKI